MVARYTGEIYTTFPGLQVWVRDCSCGHWLRGWDRMERDPNNPCGAISSPAPKTVPDHIDPPRVSINFGGRACRAVIYKGS
jgi:hypothetical protein